MAPATVAGYAEYPKGSKKYWAIPLEGDANGFRIKDLGSTNGTFLNDEPVTTSKLKVGDKIQAGDTIVSFLTDPTYLDFDRTGILARLAQPSNGIPD